MSWRLGGLGLWVVGAAPGRVANPGLEGANPGLGVIVGVSSFLLVKHWHGFFLFVQGLGFRVLYALGSSLPHGCVATAHLVIAAAWLFLFC